MQTLSQNQVRLAARQRVTELWLNHLCDCYPKWNRSEMEPLIFHTVTDLYRYLDDKSGRDRFELQTFLGVDMPTDRLTLKDISEVFAKLRLAFQQAMVEGITDADPIILERMKVWTDCQAEATQRMAELKTLNHCVTELNVMLDLVSVLKAIVQLGRTLTNGDICIVFQRDGNFLFPRANAGCIPFLSRPVEISSMMLLEPLIIDQYRQDIPLEMVRQNLNVAGIQAMTCIPLNAGNTIIGKLTTLYLTPQRFTSWQIKLQEIYAAQAGQVLHNAHLFERLGELSIEQERRRIACEMHDTVLQTLAALNINLKVASGFASQEKWEHAENLINDAHRLGKSALDEGREALKSLRKIRNISDNFSDHIQPELAFFAEQSGITPRLIVTGNDSLHISKAVAHHLCRLVGEALNNIHRHAQASNVTIAINVDRTGEVQLSIQDDGIGFIPSTVDQQNSFGLIGMRERSLSINARFDVESYPGNGTIVSVKIPRAS